MKKIIELLIEDPEGRLDTLGVDTISLVATPAIGYTWMAFKDQFVEPKSGETEDEFIGRCMVDLQSEFPDQDQRLAVCYTNWEEGKMSIDTGALTPYVEQDRKPKQEALCSCAHHEMNETETKELMRVQEELLTAAELLGEDHDPATTTYLTIHNFDENNTTVGNIADAIRALDILVGRADAQEELKTVWKYAGPQAQRKFCRAMMRLSATKFWTDEDLAKMNRTSVNPGFGEGGSNVYNVFKYAGGPNCKHNFEAYKMFKRDGKTLLIKTGEATEAPIDMDENGWKSAASRSRAAQRAAATRMRNRGFEAEHEFAVQNEEQRIVVAPAMVPNNLIRRIDENGMEYYVYFSKETVKKIAETYFAKNYTNNTDVNHDGVVSKTNTILESWIVDSPEHDKAMLYGFNVPEGTWMVSMRINDDATWQAIKSQELRGYSVAGNFLELAK